MSFQKRKKYTVKDVVNDLKKMDATPSIAYDIGNQLVYYQWTCCGQTLGNDHPITVHFKEFLDFLQDEYEKMLVRGDFWRTNDTPNAAFNQFLKEKPEEFLDFEFERSPEYIYDLLIRASKGKESEIKKYKIVKKNVKKLIKDNPEDADLWNELRLVHWILGEYKESSTAFKTARDHGWTGAISSVVGL
ncbi:MAG: hypothetical protein ACFFDR_09930 [Candidatus Thorarchaeota archaeon]